MNIFYTPGLLPQHKTHNFDPLESNHIIKVLRKKPGDVIQLTNGDGLRFSAEIINATPRCCNVRIVSYEVQTPLQYRLHMAVAPTKKMDRFEWFLEKATELGVHQISPIICKNSERQHLKTERLQKIIQTAMKQSLRDHLPQLDAPQSFDTFLKNHADEKHEKSATLRLIGHCHPLPKASLNNLLQPAKPVLIMIGPEGDFTTEEVQKALDAGCTSMHLSNYRLRTETAAIASAHAVSFVNY